MKRIVVLLSAIMLLMTGCSVTKLDSNDLGKNVKILLSEKSSLYNVFYDGYTYEEKVNINEYLNSINYIGVGILDTKRLDYTLTCDDKVIKGKVYLETD